MGIEDILKEYSYGNVGQFTAITSGLGYKSEYNNGNLLFKKDDETYKCTVSQVREHIKENQEMLKDKSRDEISNFFDKSKADDPEYIQSLRSEKNISVVRWQGLKGERDGKLTDGITIVDYNNKVCYTGKSLYEHAMKNGNLLDGKGTKLKPGIMSDLMDINGKPGKIRLTENGISIFYQKETLLIPDTILGRKLSDVDKRLLKSGDVVVIPGKDSARDIYVQVDKKLNSVIVKSNREISIPDVIGKAKEYSGYTLTVEDKQTLANGNMLKNKLIGTEAGYFIADVSITADKKGVSFTNIQSLTVEQAKKIITQQQEEKVEEKEPAPEKEKAPERNMEAEFKDAVNRNDFIKISHLKDEGYQPSTDALIALENDGKLSPNAKIAVNKIFGIDKEEKTPGDIKLAHEVSPEKDNRKLAGVAKLTDRVFADL
ncbi:MAG: DUF3945 domain-containing protein [Dysgonamonadaceae bacterium]|nr:DUF3945 domain-containing protein [Dysgonamonadaceae bacterium]